MGKLHVVRFRYFLERHQKLAYQGGMLSNLRQNSLLYLQIPFFFLFELVAYIRLLKRLKPSLVHAHWLIPQGLIAVLGSWFVKRPPKLVCTAHGADVYGLRGRLSKRLKRFVVRNIDMLTVVSSAMGCDLERETGGLAAFEVIPMGVDLTERFRNAGSKRTGHKLLFVGRLVEKKGLSYLLEAMPQIRRHIPNATLLVIGSGHDRYRYEDYTLKNGSNQYVRFLGAVPNRELSEYYQKTDLLVFPSVVADDGDREGLGLVPIEAMGCGCGVIATDLEAVQDVVQHGVNGYIVPQRSAKAIVDAVVYLFSNKAELETMQRRAIQSVCKKFDWGVIAENYCNVYRKLIE
jgi:glycosyltransferase involved in cell wall biosynthesis